MKTLAARIEKTSIRHQPTSHDNGHQGNQDRHENNGQKTGDNTLDPVGAVVDEAQERSHRDQEVDVRDGTDNGSRNGPEDDQSTNESNGGTVADNALPPFDAEVRPDHLSRVKTDVAGSHVERQVVSN